VKDVQNLQRMAAETPVGKRVEVRIFRGGKEFKLQLVLGNAESQEATRARPEETPASTWLGIVVENLPQQMRSRGLKGVIVTEVEQGSIAGEAGIQSGDVVVAVNQKPISGTADYEKSIREAEKKGLVVLLVRRGGASMYFALRTR
jgi:S1-C subfamily serine protease